MLQWIYKNIQKRPKTAAGKTVIILGAVLAAVFCSDASVGIPPRGGDLFNLSAETVYAQSQADPGSELQTGLEVVNQEIGLPSTDIRLIVARIIRAALGLIGIVLVVIVIYAGFLWMTAGGNEEQLGRAKKMLINAVIGLAIILSAYSIVSFVMKLLGVPPGTRGGGGNLYGPQTQNFRGSGALGRVIKDHYPMRDERNVPRNTKIFITFRPPVKPDSFIQENTGDNIFGNCKDPDPAVTPNWNWKDHCDQLKMGDGTISIYKVTTDANGQEIKDSIATAEGVHPLGGAAVVATYADGKVYTIVIRPNDALGADNADIKYLVHVGNNILIDDPVNDNPGLFQNSKILGNNYYEWNFTCGRELDSAPPKVDSVYPASGASAPKNSVIQINFSEAMDPSVIQGQFSGATGYYVLDGSSLFLKSGNSTVPVGKFNLVNGYRTLEFTSSLECGQNACGGKIFCLPVCDKTGANCTSDNLGNRTDSYELLLKSALVNNLTSFEARPFSGFMDAAGNALDGNGNRQVNKADNSGAVFDDTWKMADNYFWGFSVSEKIDNISPYLSNITPGIDAEKVAPNEPWRMTFSKRMRVAPLYDILIVEKPVQAIPLWKAPRVSFSDNTTVVEMSHGRFLDGLRQFYFPELTSAIEDVNFNCFYPGKGPKDSPPAGEMASPACEANGAGCCDTIADPVERSFCCNGVAGPNTGGVPYTLDSCVNKWQLP